MSMSTNAQITRQGFEKAAKDLIEDYKLNNNLQTCKYLQNWEWVEHAKIPGFGYLARTDHILRKHNRCSNGDDEEICVPGQKDEDVHSKEDPSENLKTAQAISSQVELCKVDLFVVYSPTYQVPYLLFSVADSSGTPLRLDEILSDTTLFHSTSGEVTQIKRPETENYSPESRNPFHPIVSQAEHPITGLSCYSLHPCEVGNAISEVLKDEMYSSSIMLKDLEMKLLAIWFMITNTIVDLRIHTS